MSLPENTTYNNPGGAVQAMAGAMKGIAGNAPRRKSVDTSRFSNLAGQVSTGPQGSGNLGSLAKDLGSVTTPYGGSTRYEGNHPGIDIANKIGTQVPSFTEGTVTKTEGGHKQGDKGYGNYVIVTDNEGNKHRYSHLNKSFVQVGDHIKMGEYLGGMGNTGQTYSTSGGTGSHLDYRIRDMYNKYVNPDTFINN